MNQQILEYLSANDTDTNMIGVELVMQKKKGRLQYLRFVHKLPILNTKGFFSLWNRLEENKSIRFKYCIIEKRIIVNRHYEPTDSRIPFE